MIIKSCPGIFIFKKLNEAVPNNFVAYFKLSIIKVGFRLYWFWLFLIFQLGNLEILLCKNIEKIVLKGMLQKNSL